MPKTALLPLVTIKTKYQVTLPIAIRKRASLTVGDVLEANVEGQKITLTPKSLVDRELALALEDVRKGRTVGPFNTAEEMLRHLHKQVRQYQRKKRKRTKAPHEARLPPASDPSARGCFPRYSTRLR